MSIIVVVIFFGESVEKVNERVDRTSLSTMGSPGSGGSGLVFLKGGVISGAFVLFCLLLIKSQNENF